MPYISSRNLSEHDRYVRALEAERDQLKATVAQQANTIHELRVSTEAAKLDYQTVRNHLYGSVPALGYLGPSGTVNLANDPKSFGQALGVLVQAARQQAAIEARRRA